MRLLPGLMLLLPLVSPLAQAELIDDVNDRGELLAQELDVNASLLVTDSNDLLQGVESGKYDVALNHMALTPDLENRFDFSEPYGYTHARAINRAAQPPTPTALETFQGQLIGVVQGSPFVEHPPRVTVEDTRPVEDQRVTLAIPFQKGNPAFHNSLDKALQRIKADGRLAALSQKWLGAQTPQP